MSLSDVGRRCLACLEQVEATQGLPRGDAGDGRSIESRNAGDAVALSYRHDRPDNPAGLGKSCDGLGRRGVNAEHGLQQ